MKRNFKAITSVLFAAVLAFGLVANVSAAEAETKVFLAYADEAWTYQYWADPVDTGVVATDATVTGAGHYTVGLDFTGTADGAAKGLAFTALMSAAEGSTTFDGYSYQIDAININGEEIAFTKGYTSVDGDGKNQLRENIYNSWVAAVPEDAHTVDGDVSDVSATIVDPAAFASVETITVDFTFFDAEGNDGTVAEVVATEEVAVDTAADTTATTDVPKTGVVGLGLVYGLGAIATGAAVLKRKEK